MNQQKLIKMSQKTTKQVPSKYFIGGLNLFTSVYCRCACEVPDKSGVLLSKVWRHVYLCVFSCNYKRYIYLTPSHKNIFTINFSPTTQDGRAVNFSIPLDSGRIFSGYRQVVLKKYLDTYLYGQVPSSSQRGMVKSRTVSELI